MQASVKGAIPTLKKGTFFAFFFGCSSKNPSDNSTAIYKTKKAYIWLEESQERFQLSCV